MRCPIEEKMYQKRKNRMATIQDYEEYLMLVREKMSFLLEEERRIERKLNALTTGGGKQQWETQG